MWETWRCRRKNSRPYTPMEDDALYSVGVIFYILKASAEVIQIPKPHIKRNVLDRHAGK